MTEIAIFAGKVVVLLVAAFFAVAFSQAAILTGGMIGNRTEDWWRKWTNQPPARKPSKTDK